MFYFSKASCGVGAYVPGGSTRLVPTKGAYTVCPPSYPIYMEMEVMEIDTIDIVWFGVYSYLVMYFDVVWRISVLWCFLWLPCVVLCSDVFVFFCWRFYRRLGVLSMPCILGVFIFCCKVVQCVMAYSGGS